MVGDRLRRSVLFQGVVCRSARTVRDVSECLTRAMEAAWVEVVKESRSR